jgi:hypothetical protein
MNGACPQGGESPNAVRVRSPAAWEQFVRAECGAMAPLQAVHRKARARRSAQFRNRPCRPAMMRFLLFFRSVPKH